MRNRCIVYSTGGQLEVGARAGHLEEYAVVSGVVAEAADLAQPEVLGLSGDAELH